MRYLIFSLLLATPLLAWGETPLDVELRVLMHAGKSPQFVPPGANMQAMLSARADMAERCSIRLRSGDAPYPLGDGTASRHALIACPGYTTLDLRLKREGERYHLAGFWTVNTR